MDDRPKPIVTNNMLAAGRRELADYDPREDRGEMRDVVVESIYLAMESARLSG